MKLYGINQCDTVRKARRWLTEQGRDIPFHDFRKDGLDRTLLEHWLKFVDWQTLVNRKGSTWRRLSEAEREAVHDSPSAVLLMLDKPSVIKRPILDMGERILVGFDEHLYTEALKP